MLISDAIRSRVAALGVEFLANSCSRVTSWSCVALCLFWFFCCCVSVLFRGGRLEALLEPAAPEFELLECEVSGVVDEAS